MTEEKKKRGRPPGSGKKAGTVTIEGIIPINKDIIALIEPVVPVELSKRGVDYDPFKNPRFNAKMGLKDKL